MPSTINQGAIAPHFAQLLKDTGTKETNPVLRKFRYLKFKLEKLRNPEATRAKIDLALKEAGHQTRAALTQELVEGLQTRLQDPQGKVKFKALRKEIRAIDVRIEAEAGIDAEEHASAMRNAKQALIEPGNDPGQPEESGGASAKWELPSFQPDLISALRMLQSLEGDEDHRISLIKTYPRAAPNRTSAHIPRPWQGDQGPGESGPAERRCQSGGGRLGPTHSAAA